MWSEVQAQAAARPHRPAEELPSITPAQPLRPVERRSTGPSIATSTSREAFCGSRCAMQAPTSGALAGILFFQDRANSSAATFAGDLNLNQGNGLVAHTGAYYFYDATVNFDFDFGAGAPYTLLVAKDVTWIFNFTFNNNFASLPNGSPLRQGTAVLVQ